MQTAAPAFFYSTDPNPKSRQHERPIPQQHPGLAPMKMLPVVTPLLSPTPAVYSRPGSSVSCSQQQRQPPLLPKGAYAGRMLSLSAGSTISSPSSCDLLQTPLNPMFSGLDGKDARGLDGGLESFSALDWSARASPPLTLGESFSSFFARPFSIFLESRRWWATDATPSGNTGSVPPLAAGPAGCSPGCSAQRLRRL